MLLPGREWAEVGMEVYPGLPFIKFSPAGTHLATLTYHFHEGFSEFGLRFQYREVRPLLPEVTAPHLCDLLEKAKLDLGRLSWQILDTEETGARERQVRGRMVARSVYSALPIQASTWSLPHSESLIM